MYDLFGEGVNVAVAMESNGVPGKIQVSEATAKLLAGDFELVERGVVDVKSYGLIRTYFLLSRINEDPPAINITFFKTGHWLHGMGHDRGTSVQSGIADAIFQVTGERYRDLPFRNHDLTWS